MGMNPTLAALYNTNGAAQEEQEKIAHLELFAKAASAQGIDLSELDPGTRDQLYSEFVSKLDEDDAGSEDEGYEDGEDGEDDEDYEDEEDEEEKEASVWQEKNAQVDFLGRRMAHSFWQEYNEIAKEAAGTYAVQSGLTRVLPKEKSKLRRAADRVARAIEANPKKAVAAAAGLQLAGATGAVAGGNALRKRLSGSAADNMAAEEAVKSAAACGYDPMEAAERLEAVLALGPAESTKVAHASDLSTAIGIRSLELLEQAGYPVRWG